MCSTGKKNSQILFSLASFLLMSYSCKRMSRDQIQKQPRVRAFLLVGTRRCHKLYIHAQNVARTQTHTHTHVRTDTQTQNARARAHTHARAHTTHTHTHTHTRTHAHTQLHYFRSLSPSLRHPRSFQGTIHVPPWYLFYPLRNPFLYLSDTHKQEP